MSVGQLAGGRVPALARRAAKRDPLFVAAAVVMAAIVVLAVFGPLFAPYDPNQLFTGPVSERPSGAHLLGTDDLGRDILSRILAGGAASVFAPVVVVVLSTVLGSMVAIVSAWFGGWVDGVLTRVIEVIFAIPGLVLAILAISMFGKGLVAPVLALSIAYLPVVSRLVRAGARAELGKPYMAALRTQGVSSFAITFRHLVPALLPAILAQSTLGFGYAMLDLNVTPITGGTVEGPRLSGRVLGVGADWWVTRGATTQLDARYLIEAADGSAIDVVNRGYWHAGPELEQRLYAGEQPGEDELYYRTAFVFQTGADAHRWLTEAQFVGYARAEPGFVCIRVFRLG